MRRITFVLILIGSSCVGSLHAQPLDSILMLVVENNAELKSLKLEFEAELMKADQVSQLADPQIGVGVPVLRPETRLGPQIMMVSASQMFPWFGTLKAKGDVVVSMSKVKYERIEAERLVLFNKVKIAYYKIQYLSEKELILQDVLVQLHAMKNISLAKVEAGQASSANVLRVQLKIDELNSMIEKIEQEKQKEYAIINELTIQPWTTVIVPDGEFNLPVISFDLGTYQNKIQAEFPMIRMLDLQKEVSQERLTVNQKMGAPKIGIGLDYALVNERSDMDPLYNGRDILVPKLMLTIPIYRKAYKAKEQEELFVQQALDYSKEQLITELLSLLLQFKADYDNAVIDNELSIQQIETSNLAYNILLADYSSGGRGFDDLLQVQMELLNYQLKEKQSLLSAKIAVSNIERITDY